MQRYVSRAFLASALAVLVSACATAYEPPVGSDGETAGGRFRVLIPNFDMEGGVPGGTNEEVAEIMRSQVANMNTHTSIDRSEMRQAMRHFGVNDPGEAESRQLADQMNAQVSTWGTIRSNDEGLVSDLKLIDVASGEEIVLEDIRGSDASSLGQALFTQFENAVQSVRQAAFCADYLGSDQFDRALSNCEQALEITPDNQLALYGAGTALLNLERYEESLQLYERLLELNPDYEDALLGAGFASSQLDQRSEATDYYTRYLELNPDDAQVRLSVSGDIAQTGDYISAYRVLEPAIEEEQDDIEFLEFLGSLATSAGTVALEEGNREEAEEYFTVAIDALDRVYEERGDEVEAATIRRMVQVYREMGREDEALALAERATQSHADDAATWEAYGQALTRVDRHGEAVDAYSRAIEMDPDRNRIFLRRAVARIDAGERDAARADLEEAAERGDRQEVAQFVFSRGSRAYQSDNFTDAVDLLSLAHGYASGNMQSDISFFWGVSLFRQGQAIAEANQQAADPGQAQQAINLFENARPRLQESNHAQAGSVLDATEQFIENQQAIIRASGRRR